MANLQELITRGRFLFSNAPKKLEVFSLVNGRLSTKDIAHKTGRSLSAICKDVESMLDMELVRKKQKVDGSILLKGKASVYEKEPPLQHVSLSYFQPVSDTKKLVNRSKKRIKNLGKPVLARLSVPAVQELLDIAKNGEDDLYEFKAPGTKPEKISKEVAAFLHTRRGGIVIYGFDDNGLIIGSDMSRQTFDQVIQNSVRNTITPPPSVRIAEKGLLGTKILLVIVPSWDRKTVYQYTDGRHYVRRGVNVFAVKTDELKKLLKGEYIDV